MSQSRLTSSTVLYNSVNSASKSFRERGSHGVLSLAGPSYRRGKAALNVPAIS